jgi:hypothetical protein
MKACSLPLGQALLRLDGLYGKGRLWPTRAGCALVMRGNRAWGVCLAVSSSRHSDGTLPCPENHPLSPQERRLEHDGILRVVYAARIGHCPGCPLREPVSGARSPHGAATARQCPPPSARLRSHHHPLPASPRRPPSRSSGAPLAAVFIGGLFLPSPAINRCRSAWPSQPCPLTLRL